VGVALAQAAASAAISLAGLLAFRRFPAAAQRPLAEDRLDVRRFVVRSSIGTGLVSLRATLAPLLLGVVASPLQVGYFRAAQAPQAGFASLSAPVRLILLTEQTRDFERGRVDLLFSSLRRYTAGSALLMLVLVPPLMWLLPTLIRVVFGPDAVPAVDAARLILVAAALQLVWGWTKSFPVSVGRPGLRIVAQAVELAVLAPLLLVLGSRHGATGAAASVLVATVAFVAVWSLFALRLRRAVVLPGGRLAAADS
jgi:O-antigen/teichoic acid export membrane protein